MELLSIELAGGFSGRTRLVSRPSVRRASLRRPFNREPMTMPLFPLEPIGPAQPLERFEEDVERWDGQS